MQSMTIPLVGLYCVYPLGQLHTKAMLDFTGSATLRKTYRPISGHGRPEGEQARTFSLHGFWEYFTKCRPTYHLHF